jgi:hypothetical protein
LPIFDSAVYYFFLAFVNLVSGDLASRNPTTGISPVAPPPRPAMPPRRQLA